MDQVENRAMARDIFKEQNYTFTHRRLRDDLGFCPIGVMVDIWRGGEWSLVNGYFVYRVIGTDGEIKDYQSFMPPECAEFYGLRSVNGRFKPDELPSSTKKWILMLMNHPEHWEDRKEWSISELSDFIRSPDSFQVTAEILASEPKSLLNVNRGRKSTKSKDKTDGESTPED